eukprot:scaffold306917_cov15-Tisochrysis_lutea.AAC.1
MRAKAKHQGQLGGSRSSTRVNHEGHGQAPGSSMGARGPATNTRVRGNARAACLTPECPMLAGQTWVT